MQIKDTTPFDNNTANLPQSVDPHLEKQGISTALSNRQQLHIHNINIPQRSSCSAGNNASITHLLSTNEMSLIVGDINAHHSIWGTNTNDDEIGEQLADEIDAADYTILNVNEVTRQPTNGQSTSPDNNLASNDIALLSHWSVSTSLTIDHLSILITINSELSTIDGPRRTYINFKNADWASYAEAWDKYLAEAGEEWTRSHSTLSLPASADERDRKRGQNPVDETLNHLNIQIHELVVQDKRTKWKSAVDKCDHLTGISHLWRVVMGLSGKQPHNSPNMGVRFADKTYLDPIWQQHRQELAPK